MSHANSTWTRGNVISMLRFGDVVAFGVIFAGASSSFSGFEVAPE